MMNVLANIKIPRIKRCGGFFSLWIIGYSYFGSSYTSRWLSSVPLISNRRNVRRT